LEPITNSGERGANGVNNTTHQLPAFVRWGGIERFDLWRLSQTERARRKGKVFHLNHQR